jgi:murein DD-endopeptidase MepM/ murein hydrolase activator NlpD
MAGGCSRLDEPAPVVYHTPSTPSQTIVAEEGDTVENVAHRYGVSTDSVIQANHLTTPYALTPGQTVVIPGQGETGTAQAGSAADIPAGMSADGGGASQSGISVATLGAPGQDGAPSGPAPGSMPPAQSSLPTVPPAAAPASPTPLAPNAPVRLATASPTALAPQSPPPAPQSLTPPQSAPTAPPQQMAAASPTPTDGAPGAAAGAPRFSIPVNGPVISGFGASPGGARNDGINIAAAAGTPVLAADAGTVVYAGNELAGYGNLVLIRHAGGWVTAYGHLASIGVSRGADVTRGQTIGTVGQTGSVDSPQLHFEVRENSKPVDPTPFLTGGKA